MTDLAAPVRDTPAIPLADRVARLRVTADGLSMAGLAAMAGILYFVNLTVSGYANTYYAMAAQAAGQSWAALFFGALDGQGFITIDKPPLATALMGVSVRLFGLSSASVLLPEALLGIGTVLVLYIAVRRSFGSRAALVAGLVMALTPVSVLIFRYDNPDALLTFLLVSGAWALGRGLEKGRIRWAAFAAFLVGLAFLTKYLQAWMVLPAFALVWLVSAGGSGRRRLAGLVVSAGVVAVASLWWVAVVELIPAASRPYVGGSTTNSPLELLLGYDGLGRIFGNSPTGSGLGSALDGLAFGNNDAVGPGGGFGGAAGVLRLFNDAFGGQIAWLLPAALLSILAAVAIHRRSARTDPRVGGYLLWSTWLLVHVFVFSFMSGIVHPYYSVIAVPAIAALVGAVVVELWDRRASTAWAGRGLAAGLVVTGVTAWAFLERTPAFVPGLGIGILAVSIAAAIVFVIPAGLVRPFATRAAVALALVAVLAGPLAYAADTMQTALSGGDPQPGPMAEANGGPGGPGGPAAVTESQALVDYLVANQGGARWIVAANGSMVAASIQLAAGQPVMTMGGFTGSDPTPSVDELKAAIAAGDLRYVLVGNANGGPDGGPGHGDGGGFGGGGPDGGFPGGPGGGTLSGVNAWVTTSCAAVTIAGASSGLYDCAGAG
jgi:4-amino-4-deoxy-L-arabinose transferase-like glycosyltransferase